MMTLSYAMAVLLNFLACVWHGAARIQNYENSWLTSVGAHLLWRSVGHLSYAVLHPAATLFTCKLRRFYPFQACLHASSLHYAGSRQEDLADASAVRQWVASVYFATTTVRGSEMPTLIAVVHTCCLLPLCEQTIRPWFFSPAASACLQVTTIGYGAPCLALRAY